MLLKRIITASFLAPIAIALTVLLPSQFFAELLMLIMIISLFEWDNLTLRSNKNFVLSALGVLIVGTFLYLLAHQKIENSLPNFMPLIAIIGALFWLLQNFTLAKGIQYRRTMKLEMAYGTLVILCAWSSMVWLRDSAADGPYRVLIAMLIVWAADTFAYFSGKSFGKRKLAPSISPGKTIEGLIGGIIGAVLTAGLGAELLLNLTTLELVYWLITSAAAALISVVGDLYVSRLKRQKGVKDSGKLLPGHGGILDRIDGLLAAMPVFVTFWWLLG